MGQSGLNARQVGTWASAGDWRDRLIAFAYARLGDPFKWGECDCTIFALECLDVITGGDHADLARGHWHDRKSAYRYSREVGFTFESYLIDQVGAWDVSDQPLTLGDFILIDQVIARRRLWRRPAVYLGRDHAVVADHASGAVSCGRISQFPEFNTVLRVRG